MSLGIECLLCEDEALARDMAQQLDELNKDRKAIEQGMQREALAQLKDLPVESLPFGLCLFEPDWHQGVIGILASRLKERYHRPAIAFAAAFDAEVRRQLSEDDLTGRLLSDGQLGAEEFHLELAKALRHAGPWGQHFPEPLFHGVFQIVTQRVVGEKHLKLVLKTECGSLTLDGIAFNVDRDIWPNPNVRWVELAYKLDVNEYQGRESVQLMVAHLAPR